MTGTTIISPRSAGQFDYREQGRFYLLDGRALDAKRHYIFQDIDGGFAVFFAETPPRVFHRVVLAETASGLTGRGSHLCGEDRYDSRYEFRADGSFIIAHAARGPRKAYTVETRYVRALV